MTFKEKLEKVILSLKLTDKIKAKSLTAEDWKTIAASYKEANGTDLYADSEAEASEDDKKKVAAHDRALALLAEKKSEKKEEEDEEDEENDEEDKKGSGDSKSKGKGKKAAKGSASLEDALMSMLEQNKAMTTQVATLTRQTELDNPGRVKVAPIGLGGAHTAAHLFGIQHPMFEAAKRWNQIAMRGRSVMLMSDPDEDTYEAFKKEVHGFGRSIALRMQELHAMGMLNLAALNASAGDSGIDYSNLEKAGLGEQYLVRRQDALIARILELPNVFAVFPLRSNVQDKDLITNAFFGEFSQGYQEGEISKGGARLEPEAAQVNDVMFKYLFRSMKWIETQYIGYLNTNGSDPVKWSMIEWMIMQIAIVLKNEQNVRYVQGCHVKPIPGKNGHFLNASTGIIHRLISYVEAYKVLPFYEDGFTKFTVTHMCDAVIDFVGKVHGILPNLLNKAIYINDRYKPTYQMSYRKKFGTHTDFKGEDLAKVPNYDIPIIWVPNVGTAKFMWVTDLGNMQCLEYKPGEMYNIRFEQRLENVWGYSVWKEGAAAAFSGPERKSLAALKEADLSEQVIFTNWPATTLAANATTVDEKESKVNFMFTTAANTEDVAITDIENARPGVVYRIEVGSEAHPQSIAKAGKFSEISEAWEPTKEGQWIKLLWEPTLGENGKFREVARG